MATILEREGKNGKITWQAQVRRQGKSTFKSFSRKTDAERWARQQETAVEQGVFTNRAEAERNTLRDLIERYQRDVTPEKQGADREDNHLSTVLNDEIADIRMAHLGSGDIAGYRDRMKKAGLAPSTIVRRLNLISTVIGHAKREWGVNVVENVASAKLTARPKGADRKRDRRLIGDEEERLFAKLAEQHHAIYLVAIARLAIETACRQGELCSLKWHDIDTDNRVMTVRGLSGEGSKNGEIRQVPLSTAAIEAIKTLPRAIRDQRLFPIDQNTLKVAYRRAVARAKIDDLTFHDLRHEATSRLAATFTNPLELMRITGHKTLNMLARYYHANAAEQAKRLA